MNQRPIGVFDSGLGGLTAVRQLRRIMPSENIIYFGDTARVPYGNRGRETLLKYARQDLRFLTSFDLKAVVIACGTVSTNCLEDLQAESGLPVIGVVDPACRGMGVGSALLTAVTAHPTLRPLRGILATRDAHKFYQKFGFTDGAPMFMQTPIPF